jgi:hypothetical protein
MLGRGRHRAEQSGELPTQRRPVLFGDAEQLTDDRERQRERERGHQVDLAIRAHGGDGIEEIVDDRVHPRPQPFDPANRERGRHQATQTGVIRRVDVEHVPGEHRAGKALRHHVRTHRQRGMHVLGEPGIVQRGAGLVIANHQPRVMSVNQLDRVHCPTFASCRVQREGIVPIVSTPRPERPLDRRHRCHPR